MNNKDVAAILTEALNIIYSGGIPHSLSNLVIDYEEPYTRFQICFQLTGSFPTGLYVGPIYIDRDFIIKASKTTLNHKLNELIEKAPTAPKYIIPEPTGITEMNNKDIEKKITDALNRFSGNTDYTIRDIVIDPYTSKKFVGIRFCLTSLTEPQRNIKLEMNKIWVACAADGELYNTLNLEIGNSLNKDLEVNQVKENFDLDIPKPPLKEAVNHPIHYGGDTPYEAIKVIEAWELGFCLGNTVKYISRAGKKEKRLEDLQKALWYLKREINSIVEQEKKPSYKKGDSQEEGNVSKK